MSKSYGISLIIKRLGEKVSFSVVVCTSLLAALDQTEGSAHQSNCDPLTHAIRVVHGEHMVGKPMEERLKHLKHTGELYGQRLTHQLVYDIVAEESFQSVIRRAGFGRYAWLWDAGNYLQLEIPAPLDCSVAQPLAALGQILLIVTAASAKIHGASMKYISEKDLESREVFQWQFVSNSSVMFFECMFPIRCMVKHTQCKPVILRRIGMHFKLKDWFDCATQGKFPLVLPCSFDEKLHEFSAHSDRFVGAYNCFFRHDCWAHGANITYMDILGQSYFSEIVATQKILNQICKSIALQGALDAMSAEYREELHDIDAYLLGLGMGYHYVHEGVMAFPSGCSLQRKAREVHELFSPLKDQCEVSNIKENFAASILRCAIKQYSDVKPISDDLARFNAVKEWAPAYLERSHDVSPEMIMDIFDHMNAYVFEKNGFYIFDTPDARESFEEDLTDLWEDEPIGELALHPSIDFCILDHKLYPQSANRRLVLPRASALLGVDPLVIRHMVQSLFCPDIIWFRKVMMEMAQEFRDRNSGAEKVSAT